MVKRGRNQKKVKRNSKRSSHEHFHPKDMEDEIDAFHKQRDIIPLDVNGDDGESTDDDEEPVFDDEDIDNDDGDDEEEDDDAYDTKFASKIRKQQKYFKEKFGAMGNEIHDDEDENDEDKKEVWGGKKPQYYGGHDYEGDSSDDEALKEEEEEILRMQREKAKNLSMEDFGLENVGEDENNRELTLEELSVKGKSKTRDSLIKEVEDNVDTFEEVKKDLNALSREEQMDVVYSSAPELVGLLSELNDALEQLESRVNPLLSTVKMGGTRLEGAVRYLEVEQLLLLAYCQAITFYLLLKSEGQPVRDHPVIARLVEIKGLLDKVKELDGNLPSEIEEFLKKNSEAEKKKNKVSKSDALAFASESVRKDCSSSLALAEPDAQEPAEPCSTRELVKMETSEDHVIKKKKHKRKIDEVGFQSLEMLKVRAALEEKLKQNGVFSSFAPKPNKAKKHAKSVNGQLQTYDDFNDDALDVEKGKHGLSNGHTSFMSSNKISQLVSARPNKPKVISGDDDLPKRDDIGERRRKHELKVLAGAGIKSEDDAVNEPGTLETDEGSDMEEDSDPGVSEDEFYRETKQIRDAKLAAKAKIYARNPSIPSLPETVDGKRQITYQIEKNKGLTRPRKKDLKNPRKKYRTKHDKQVKRRKGQVQQVKKPIGPYGGETSGINAGISRSIRF
ncbi:something about silencing protein 10 [Manihot esculenta]|uniref:Sas10 C-terminal domain-containing protein n=1 Tax=Manihot esculenta TaxID=3983 RepID=A0A2C9U9I8_MANES|nr:something about silencing protein 10 [Manihot esculenta]OAY26721.1 hypothetical protein MANES_16G069500v8 [Manihot esculenta]